MKMHPHDTGKIACKTPMRKFHYIVKPFDLKKF